MTYFWFTSFAASSVHEGLLGVCFFFFLLSTSIATPTPVLASFHLDFISPTASSCRPLLSLYFLPLPSSAWLRCEIILLLGGFPAIRHCHRLALRLERGSPFPKAHRTPLHHPEHNKFLGTSVERGVPAGQPVLLSLAE